MKIAVRTLQQRRFEIEAEPQHTVLNLKKIIGEVQGHPAEHLKLFYAGRTLSDDSRSVESLNIREDGYMTVMVTKPRSNNYEPAPATTGPPSGSDFPRPSFARPEFTTPTASTTPAAPVAPTNPVPLTSSNTPSFTPIPRPAANSQNPLVNGNRWTSPSTSGSSMMGAMLGPSMLGSSMSGSSTLGASRPSMSAPSTSGSSVFEMSPSEASMNNLVEMGFERAQVVKALKASFGNTERAVEYLTTSIPENLLDESDSSSPNPFAASSFLSFGSTSSASGPFSMSSMSSPFMRPQPVPTAYIEEVGPDQPEEPSKPTPSVGVPTSESSPTPLPTPQNEVSAIPAAPTSSEAVPPTVSGPSSEIFSRPIPSTSNFASTSSEPMDISESSASSSSASEEPVTLESLENDPMIQQIRELARQNLELLPSLMEQLIQSKPQVAKLMSSNPQGLAMLLAGGGGYNFASTSSEPMDISESSASNSSASEEPVTLESLENDPMIQRIRELAGQNPELLAPLMEQLIQSKPQVAKLMSSNPQGLAVLLRGGGGGDSSRLQSIFNTGGPSNFSEDEVDWESLENDPIVKQLQDLDPSQPELVKSLLEQLISSRPQVARLIATDSARLGALLCGRGNSSRVETRLISITREEKEAIERLEGLGFPGGMVLQAYFAFDKNEELAANYLIENCADD